jgi:feruloyl esterase
MKRDLAFVALLSGLAAAPGGCSLAPSSPAAARQDSAARCSELVHRHVAGTTIAAAVPVTNGDGLPGYCRVQGIIDPGIRYEARLPLSGWNGKYYQSGCGGYCGSVLPDKKGFSNTINEALKLGYAAITTDNGHEGGLGDASWAAGQPEAVALYAYRGIELTYRAGTGLTRAFYGSDAARRYFGGCSNGGRMAAMAAQRYPSLFDGILGGGAVLNLSQNGGIHGSWIVQSNTRRDGSRILNRATFARKLPALEADVLAQCDGTDGRKDGVITRPRQCNVDVGALPACGAEDRADCFTGEEREVIGRWYRGARDSAGRQLYPGVPPGSERFWLVWFLDSDTTVAPGNALGGDYARYLGFPQQIPAGWTALDFNFDTDPARLVTTGKELDALNPDLKAFRRAGGKLLMWHGWADPLVLPDQSVDYFNSVVARLGGVDGVRSFFRLFMIPGQGHCWDLPASTPDQFNPIVILDNWVETGKPPEFIVATSASGSGAQALLCPYPAEARMLEAGQSADAQGCHFNN